MAMVVNAQRNGAEVGGHISSYASMATLYEVAYNHFFRGGDGERPGRSGLFSGPHHARQLRARLSGVPPGGKRISTISAANWPTAAAFPPIRIPI